MNTETPNPLDAISEADQSEIRAALLALGESKNRRVDGRMVANDDPQAHSNAMAKLKGLRQRLGMNSETFLALCKELERDAKNKQDTIQQREYDESPNAPGSAEAGAAAYTRDRLNVALNMIGREPAEMPV